MICIAPRGHEGRSRPYNPPDQVLQALRTGQSRAAVARATQVELEPDTEFFLDQNLT